MKLEENSTVANNLKAIHKDKTPTLTKALLLFLTDNYGCVLDEIVIKNNPILIVHSLDLILGVVKVLSNI